MNIEIDEIESALKIIFSHLREIDINSIEITDDFYWEIDQEELYDTTKDPKKFSIGQLTDDLQEMKKFVSGEGTPVGYSLVWAAALCRYVGEKSQI